MKSPHLATTFLCLILIEVTEQSKMSHCGQLQRNPIPLITHSEPEPHRWPWHAAIFHIGKEQTITYKCGGTAISANEILTAAHCVTIYNKPIEHKQIAVSLGRLNLSNVNETGAQWPTVAEIIPHPNYDSSYYSDDIAIIRLSTDIKFNEFVQPICLWSASKTNFSEIDGRLGIVVGWGQTETGEVSNELRQASLPVISPLACLETHRDFFGQHLSSTKFCAGFRNGTSVCVGDSGGSMVFEDSEIYYVRGIVSVSVAKVNHTTHTHTCDPMEYALFTDVARYLSWVEESQCKKKATCEWVSFERHHLKCRLEQQCRMVFEDIFSTATELDMYGQLDALPDISDGGTKFINLKRLYLRGLHLKILDRARLTAFSKIEELNLSNNDISQLASHTFDDLIDLKHLNLLSNVLEELHADTFEKLPNLRSLSLTRNRFQALPVIIFRNNEKLEKIELSDNRLKELHVDTFDGLANLQTLSLSFNRIETLSENIFRNNNKLETINLDGNYLRELHADTFNGLANLRNLSLFSSFQIEILPTNIFRNNKKLEMIELSHDGLKELHVDTFDGLANLQTLSLSFNKIEMLPTNIFRSNKKLENVHLDNNALKELHANTFNGLADLQILWLSSNQLETLSANIFSNNHKLEEIFLSHNALKELNVDTFNGLANLKTLFLNDNQFKTLTANFFHNNKKLEVINLEDNYIEELHADTFDGLANLRTLWLSFNNIEIVPTNIFRSNQKLENVHLNNNAFLELHPDTFKGLANLQMVYLKYVPR